MSSACCKGACHASRPVDSMDPKLAAVPISELLAQMAGQDPNDELKPSVSFTQVVGLPIGEDALNNPDELHYAAPCAGGWGIARGATQVPESIVIFQAPLGCGRHGSVAACMNGYRDRMFYVDITEEEIVMGSHMDKLEAVVDRVLKLRQDNPPRAVWLFSTCIDDLLGSDYPNLCRRMEAKYGIPFMDGHMNPITMSSSTPPQVTLTLHTCQLLVNAGPVPKNPKAVSIVGNFVTIDETSELYTLLAQAGFDTVHQLPACQTYDEFLAMRESSANLLLKPFGRLGCKALEEAFGTPWHLTGMAYDPRRVAQMYDKLGEFLGVKLPYEPYYEQALAQIEAVRPQVEGLNVGVGSNLNGSSFEVAAMFARMGANISFILAGEVAPSDLPYIEELCALSPTIPVYPAHLPKMALVNEVDHPTDVAVGLDAARLAPNTAPLRMGVSDAQPFGFEATAAMIAALRTAFENRGSSVKEMIYAEALVL